MALVKPQELHAFIGDEKGVKDNMTCHLLELIRAIDHRLYDTRGLTGNCPVITLR
jgi:hypothetical protein